MKLSFAHAEGRNYRQLPARTRLREEPSPADISYLRDMRFQVCMSVGRCFFGTRVPTRKLLGFGKRGRVNAPSAREKRPIGRVRRTGRAIPGLCFPCIGIG